MRRGSECRVRAGVEVVRSRAAVRADGQRPAAVDRATRLGERAGGARVIAHDERIGVDILIEDGERAAGQQDRALSVAPHDDAARLDARTAVDLQLPDAGRLRAEPDRAIGGHRQCASAIHRPETGAGVADVDSWRRAAAREGDARTARHVDGAIASWQHASAAEIDFRRRGRSVDRDRRPVDEVQYADAAGAAADPEAPARDFVVGRIDGDAVDVHGGVVDGRGAIAAVVADRKPGRVDGGAVLHRQGSIAARGVADDEIALDVPDNGDGGAVGDVHLTGALAADGDSRVDGADAVLIDGDARARAGHGEQAR